MRVWISQATKWFWILLLNNNEQWFPIHYCLKRLFLFFNWTFFFYIYNCGVQVSLHASWLISRPIFYIFFSFFSLIHFFCFFITGVSRSAYAQYDFFPHIHIFFVYKPVFFYIFSNLYIFLWQGCPGQLTRSTNNPQTHFFNIFLCFL